MILIKYNLLQSFETLSSLMVKFLSLWFFFFFFGGGDRYVATVMCIKGDNYTDSVVKLVQW